MSERLTRNENKVMNNKTQLAAILLATLILGGIIGITTSQLFSANNHGQQRDGAADNQAQSPLYWVAPMDDSYRRDKPGKSPMGMDLVPVYAQGNTQDSVGTVSISPEVINNLGVRTALAERRALAREISTVGYVTYDENKLVHIHPRVDGWIEKLHVKAQGEEVSKGQALYAIYSPELVNAQEEYLLALARNNQQLILAAENRLVSLQFAPQTISKLKQSKQVAQQITFYAPQQGVVEELAIREGFYVKPGATIMSIGDLSQVWVEAEVFERQAASLELGATATLTLDYLPGKVWHGKVDYIYPTLSATTRTVKVRLSFDNPLGEFKPNMFAQVIIKNPEKSPVLTIPKEALIRTANQQRVVLALGEGKFKSIEVVAGQFDNRFVEIISGLAIGDKVVTSAQFLIDSESSKSSDYQRFTAPDDHAEQHHQMMNHDAEQQAAVSSANVDGTVNQLMLEHRMINISREAIEKWQRPAATMDFVLSQMLDDQQLQTLKLGQRINFTFEIIDGDFVVVEFIALANSSAELHEAHQGETEHADESN